VVYGIGRWPLFWNGLQVLARGGWWRFFKYHQYVLGGMSYVEHYQRIVAAIRARQRPRDLSYTPPEGGERGEPPATPRASRLPVVS
jgi:hypothetical protein